MTPTRVSSPMRALVAVLAMTAAIMGVAGVMGAAHAAETGLERTAKLGPVSARVTLTPEAPLIGDPVELLIEVTARSGVELLMPEFGEALDRFMILDFVPVPDRVDADGHTVASQRYTLQPPTSGPQSIPPILVEFVDRRPGQKVAPDGEDAYELLTERIDFEVQSVVPVGETPDLLPLLGRLDPIPEPSAPRWPWAAVVVVLAMAAAPFMVRAWLRWRRLARRRSAYDIARAQLERLLDRKPEGETGIDAFFVELSGIIRRYIENRFELRAPEYTTEEFLQVVGDSPDVSEDHQRLLREFLRQADLVKFAHVMPSRSDVDHSVAHARRFLDETREHAPLIDEEGEDGASAAPAGAQGEEVAHV